MADLAYIWVSTLSLFMKIRWPPLSESFWELRTCEASTCLKVELRGSSPPIVWADTHVQAMPGRLLPLLHVASVAAWKFSSYPSGSFFYIQFHDENPGYPCLRFDAPIDDFSSLLPDPYILGSHGYQAIRDKLVKTPLPSWDLRIPRFFWRGSTTGNKAITIQRLPQNLRYQLCVFTNILPDLVDARFTRVVQCRDSVSNADVALHLQDNSLLSSTCDPLFFGMHQFLIEIDGNVNSWGFFWKLLLGSCVLRVESSRRQWFHSDLLPFVHYVPVSADLSNLTERITWCLDNLPHCRTIGRNGQILAKHLLSRLGQSVSLSVSNIEAIIDLP